MARKTTETEPATKDPTLYETHMRVRGTLDAAIAAGAWESARTSLEQLEQIHAIAIEEK